MKVKKVQLHLPDDLVEWLREQATKETRPLAAQIRHILRTAKERADG